MSEPGRSGALRRVRSAAIAVGALLGVTALMLPSMQAQAQTQANSSGSHLPVVKVSSADLGHIRQVPGAVRATGVMPTVGKHGAAFAAKSPNASAHPEIIGGSPVNSSAYPYVVGIETYFIGSVDSSGQGQWWIATCTGTILSPTKVLTAGHCDTDLFDGTTYVMAGQNVLNPNGSVGGGFVSLVSSIGPTRISIWVR